MNQTFVRSSWTWVVIILILAGSLLAAFASRISEIRFGIIDPPVVAQTDITVRIPMSNQQLDPAPLECSGMIWADGVLLIVSDRHSHALFLTSLNMDTMYLQPLIPLVIIGNEQELVEDAEAVTAKANPGGRTRIYAMSSLSNDRAELALPKRQHFVRFELLPGAVYASANPVVLNLNQIRQEVSRYFEKAGIEPYRTWFQEFEGHNKNTYRWGNVEGITFSPDSSSLLCGMRNPLDRGRAIIFVLENVDRAFDTRDASIIRISDMFTLDLGRRGISDICWDPVSKGFLISAATCNGPRLNENQPWPPNELDSALFWWTGRKDEQPVLVATFPDMKIEAVCRLGTSNFIALGSDEADVSEGRTRQHQSILTVMYFTGPGPLKGDRK